MKPRMDRYHNNQYNYITLLIVILSLWGVGVCVDDESSASEGVTNASS